MVTLSFPPEFLKRNGSQCPNQVQLTQLLLGSASTTLTFLSLLEEIGTPLFSPVLCLYHYYYHYYYYYVIIIIIIIIIINNAVR